MAKAKLLIHDPREARKISRCRFCTKAARIEYFLSDRHICNDCVSRLKRQSPDCVELPLLHHQVLMQYQEAPDCQAIANSLKLPRTRVAVILKGLGELGLVSLPSQEAIAQGEEVGAVPSLPRIPQSRVGKRRRVERQDTQGNTHILWSRDAEILDTAQKYKGNRNYAELVAKELGISAVQVRKRLNFLREARFDVPRPCQTRRRVERQDAQGNTQILWSRDAEILDTAQKCKGDPNYAVLIAKELGIGTIQVRKRLTFLRKAGFDVPQSRQERECPLREPSLEVSQSRRTRRRVERQDAQGNVQILWSRDAEILDTAQKYKGDLKYAELVAKELGISAVQVRKRLTFLRKAGFDVPQFRQERECPLREPSLEVSQSRRTRRRVERQDAQGNAQILWSRDAEILDTAQKCKGDPNYAVLIAKELGIGTIQVRKRLTFLRKAGFDVPQSRQERECPLREPSLEVSQSRRTRRRVERQDAQGNVQILWSRDAEILDTAQKYKGDLKYAELVAKELGISAVQVRKRLTFLRKAGFDVPQFRQERECPLREPSLEVSQSRRTRRRVERQDAQGNAQILWSRDAEILDTAQKYKGDLKYAELVAKELGISAVQVRKRLNFLRKAGFDVPRSYQDRDYPRRKDAEGNYRSLAWRDAQVFDASRRYMDDPDHARKIAEALGTGEKHVRDRLTYLQKLGFEIPLRISRKGRPKQVPTATDALILDKIPKYRGEQAFVTRIAIELGLSASYVSRRIAVLASAGFDVPSRSAQWRQRIGEILEMSARGKSPREIACQLGLADVKNVAKIIRQNTPSSQLRCKSIAAKVYQFLRDRPASRPKTVCEWLKEEKRETVLWSINQLKRQGLIRSDKGALRIVREMDPALIKSHFKSHHEYSEKEQYASNQ